MYPRHIIASPMLISRPIKAKNRAPGALDTKASRAGMAFAMMAIPFAAFGFVVMVLLITKG
jgi:hypothetical protein